MIDGLCLYCHCASIEWWAGVGRCSSHPVDYDLVVDSTEPCAGCGTRPQDVILGRYETEDLWRQWYRDLYRDLYREATGELPPEHLRE